VAKYNESTNTFTTGELSPKVHNRTDLEEYKQGVAEMLNFVPATSGGAFRRMGSEFLLNLNDIYPRWAKDDVVLIPFRSVVEDFVIALKIPTSENNSLINAVPTDVLPAVDRISATAHGLETADRVRFDLGVASTAPVPLIDGDEYYVIKFNDDFFQLAVPGGGVIDITTAGVGTFTFTETNTFTIGEGGPFSGVSDNGPIQVFSRKFNAAATSGYQQLISYPSVDSPNPNGMPALLNLGSRFKQGLDPRGFKSVQFGDDVIITHASGEFAPLGIRLIAIGGTGVGLFFPYLVVLPPDTPFDGSGYMLPDVTAGGKPIEFYYKKILKAIPFQPQNTNEAIQMYATTSGPTTTSQVSTDGTDTIIIKSVDANGSSLNVFSDLDKGSMISLLDSGNATEGIMMIETITAGDEVTGPILVGFSGLVAGIGNATFRWSASSFSNNAGFPRVVGFYQGRLHLGSTALQPLTLWASDTNDIFLLRDRLLTQDSAGNTSNLEFPGPIGDHPEYPFPNTLKSKRTTALTWILDNDLELRMGTPEGDYTIGFGAEGDVAYSRNNADFRPQSSHGSISSQPQLAGSRIIYMSLDASRIRAIDTNSRELKYQNFDLSLLADHMRYQPESTLTSADKVNSADFSQTYYQNGSDILWCINSRGNLVGVTLDVNIGTTAWHKHILGGSPTIAGVASAFNVNSRHEDLVIVTKRTVKDASGDDLDVAYLEAIGETYNHTTLTTDVVADEKETEDKPRYVDCFLKINQASSTTVAGLTHLRGQTVSVFYEGATEEDLTVSLTGTLTLSNAATEVLVGYKYKSRLKTLNLDRGQQFGGSRGNIARTDRVTISLYNSSAGRIADGEESFNDMELDASDLFNGDIRHDLSQTPSREPVIIIETEKPLPLNILGITTRGVSYDG